MKMWKWIHTSTCPNILEYGGCNSLRKYCLECLEMVLYTSSTDWHKYSYVTRKLKSENRKMRSLHDFCVKEIIEGNIPFDHLPDIFKNQITEIKNK